MAHQATPVPSMEPLPQGEGFFRAVAQDLGAFYRSDVLLKVSSRPKHRRHRHLLFPDAKRIVNGHWFATDRGHDYPPSLLVSYYGDLLRP